MMEFAANRCIAWTSLATGAVTGLVLGLWSFDGPVPVPAMLGDYDDVARRLARLGHIAFFGLGILNLLVARELPSLALGPGGQRLAAAAMNLGNVFLPLTLFAAAAYRPLKYALPFSALAVAVALTTCALGARHARR
jgi:hypothetical protein